MSNAHEKPLRSYLRTVQIDHLPPVKISVYNDRIFIPIESNVFHLDQQQDIHHRSPILPIDITGGQRSSTKSTTEIANVSLHPSVEQSSLTSTMSSQLMPDSIINDKQTTKRISNSTHLSKFIPLAPTHSSANKSSNFISNDLRYYPIGSLFTSTSTYLMHQNGVIAAAHAAASHTFLSDTIFIILIATLIIIILLFCLGLFCLCRRTTKRHISPSFDGGSYAEFNGPTFGIPIDDQHQEDQRNTKYENHIPLINDQIPLSPTVALHHPARPKVQINSPKLKKKRAGFCCCNSKRSTSTTVNARTRT